MARKVKGQDTIDETGSQVVRSTGEEITVVTKTGKKVTYIKNRTTSVETITPEVKVETKEKDIIVDPMANVDKLADTNKDIRREKAEMAYSWRCEVHHGVRHPIEEDSFD